MNIIRVGYLSGGNTLMVNVESGAVVSATNGTKTVTGVSVDGLCKLRVQAGTWTVIATKGSDVSQPVDVVVTDSYSREMSFGLPLSSLAEGALVRLNESGAGVNYYLSKHDYESGLNGAGRTLVVRSNSPESRVWSSTLHRQYNLSDISTYLNSTFLDRFDEATKALIGTTKFYILVGNSNSNEITRVTTLEKPIFLLSAAEYGFPLNTTDGSVLPILIRNYHTSTGAYWCRSPFPNSGYKGYICTVATTSRNRAQSNTSYPFLPTFTLPSTAMVSATPNADGSYTLIV